MEKLGGRVDLSHRVIEHLRWAKPAGKAPFGPSRARGAKGAGLRYERQLGDSLPLAAAGLWWEFEDSFGKGFCQTDLLLELPQGLVVVEVKYTWVPEGHSQISKLYRPVLEAATGKKVFGIVACKALVPGIPFRIVGDLNSALGIALAGREVVWQALPLIPPSRRTRRKGVPSAELSSLW